MAFRVYNTLSRQKEVFTPTSPGQVGMYVCGITPYGCTHLGHARCYIAFDVIYRYLLFKGYKVKYIQNITDIDDKIILKAREEGKTTEEIAHFYTNEYFDLMKKLKIKKATFFPTVTSNIQDIVQFIKRVIDKGFAYRIDEGVFFDTARFHNYGALSKRPIDSLLPGERIEHVKGKKNFRDFSLWKKGKPGEPQFESPWGPGRPGWHIECSAISMKFLGETIDLHGGGQDLVFPHHENEIAQSESVTGHQVVRYWVHNGLLKLGDEKMSKSKGNLLPLGELLGEVTGDVLRYYLMGSHYRRPVVFSWALLQDAKRTLNRYSTFFRRLQSLRLNDSLNRDESTIEDVLRRGRRGFQDAMDDDFNTPKALAVLHGIVTELNNVFDIQDSRISTKAHDKIRDTFHDLFGRVLGLGFPPELLDPKTMGQVLERRAKLKEILAKWRVSERQDFKESSMAEESGSFEISVDCLIELRATLRRKKMFEEADKIRDDLKEIGILIEDFPDHTSWRIKD